MPNALILYGGWPGHQPERFAALAKDRLFDGFDVEITSDLAVLESSDLNQRDLILPVWTQGELIWKQEQGVLQAIEEGTGLVGFHGTADAFRGNPNFHFLLGGSFTAHPGDMVEYTVHITSQTDPITSGFSDFQVRSEQYYMLVAPDNEVLATTTSVLSPVRGLPEPSCRWRGNAAGDVAASSIVRSVTLRRSGTSQKHEHSCSAE